MSEKLKAPFTWFGGKSLADETVWSALGADCRQYIEPFSGSAAMLLAAPLSKNNRMESLNDLDGFVTNFWRAVANDPDSVAKYSDWPNNEIDKTARHAWLVNRAERLRWSLADPDFFCPKTAGWWAWGISTWIGGGFCSGQGPYVSNGVEIFKIERADRKGTPLPGITQQLPQVGRSGVQRIPEDDQTHREFLTDWMRALHERMRDVRICCGDWSRMVSPVTIAQYTPTAIFLDPPYTVGNMDYAVGGTGGAVSTDVRKWCKENGDNPELRIVLCGYADEHDELLQHGWWKKTWTARLGYGKSEEARANTASETIWCSPHALKSTESPYKTTSTLSFD